MQFFCKAMPYTPLLVATSVNSAMKICLACSLCDMKNPMRPKNCFTTDYFDNFSQQRISIRKNLTQMFRFALNDDFFSSVSLSMYKSFFLCTIGFILHLFSQRFLALNCNFNF